MSWLVSPRTRGGGGTVITPPADINSITDEDLLRQLWQQAEDPSERRKYRSRMYRLKEERLREMVQNDKEELGALVVTQDTSDSSYDTYDTPQRKPSNIQVTMKLEGGTAVTDSITANNVKLGSLTMRGIDADNSNSTDKIINERISNVSKDRTERYQRILGELDQPGNEAHVSVSKSTYSIQSNALAGGGYLSMKNKEVRDSVSPTRALYGRKSPGIEENDGLEISDNEIDIKLENEINSDKNNSKNTSKSSSRKTSRDERPHSPIKNKMTDTSVKSENKRKVSERKLSKDLDLNLKKNTDKSTSSAKSSPVESPTRSTSKKLSTSPTRKSPTKSSPSSPTRRPKLDDIANQMDKSAKEELLKLDSYLRENLNEHDEIINESEENVLDDKGHEITMRTETRKNKDGSEFTARTTAQSTKIVDSEADIDEILIGNPDHEVLDREVVEEEGEDGSKIKIIIETRRRPDGIEYTTKNVLKTSKIFDYDHPEDICYCENDELISTDEKEEIDEQGSTIKTVTETRRKDDGVEYTTKKVYKTSKVSTKITPSDDDEVIDSKETEEIQDDGSIVRVVIETRKTSTGAEYTHRQVFKTRRMTLSALELQKGGLPMMNNDDEVINKKEKDEIDESGAKITVVTETRRRQDGSTYSYDYAIRKFQGTEKDLKNMAPVSNNTNINVSAEDELIKEDVKEELQKDGSTVKTIIERRRAKDGTEYLRHRIMKIPKMPEPELFAASLDDEVLEEDINEEIAEDGTKLRAITERRRSSASGLQYTLRRMSKVFQSARKASITEDVIMDENIAEEELDDGSLLKTIIKRFQRPDGSMYTTHNVHKSYHSPTPITVVGHENDELIEETMDEEETEDGYVIKTITEVRRRPDGVQYTIEKSEKKAKQDMQRMIYTTEKHFNTSSPAVEIDTNEDLVVSRDENEYPEEDGTVVTTVIEVRRRSDGTEYTTKTIQRSIPLIVPDRETSYVVVKADNAEDEESGFAPSLDDEIVYVRKKEEIDEKGNPITVVIETRQSKTTGEKYNLTKRVHTVDVLLTDEGEKEITKDLKISQKSIQLSGIKGMEKTVEIPNASDDVPYGSVSALKNRFVPKPKGNDLDSKNNRPEKVNTLNKKKFFEDAAKLDSTSKSSLNKTILSKSNSVSNAKKTFESKKSLNTTSPVREKASLELTLNVGKDAEVKNVVTTNLIMEPFKNSNATNNDENAHKEVSIVSEDKNESDSENIPPAKNMNSVTNNPPQRKKPEVEKKKIAPSKEKREISPKKNTEPAPKRKSPTLSKPTAKKEPVQRPKSPQKKSPIRKEQKTSLSPPQIPGSPYRGRSPNRSGVSTPRDGTPTGGRQCCQRHREQSGIVEQTSPPQVQKQTPARPTSPRKSQAPLDNRKPASRMNSGNGKVSEPRKTRPQKLNTEKSNPIGQRSRDSSARRPLSKSPEKPLNRGTNGRSSPKSPTKPKEKISTKSSVSPKSSLSPAGKQPIISHPETPMTEEVKLLPNENEDVEIEDVSNEPTLPYHRMQRPSIVREPSECPQSEDEEDESTIVKDNNLKNVSDSTEKRLIDTASKKETKVTKIDKPVALTDIGIFKKTSEITSKYLDDVEKSIMTDKEESETNSIGRNVGNRYNPNGVRTSGKPARKISLETKGNVSSRRSMFENGGISNEPAKKSNFQEPIFKKNNLTSQNTENRKPVEEPLIEPTRMYLCGESKENTSEDKNEKVTRQSSKSNILSESNVNEVSKSNNELNSRKSVDRESVSSFTRESSPYLSREGSPSPFVKEGSPGKFATGKPIDQGVDKNKIKRLERAGSHKKLFEDLEVPKSQLPSYISDLEKIEDVATLESMLQKAENYEERRLIRGQLRNAKKLCATSTASVKSSSYSRFTEVTPKSSPRINRGDTKENITESRLKSRTSSINSKILSQSDDNAKWHEQTESVTNSSSKISSSSSEFKESSFAEDSTETSKRNISTERFSRTSSQSSLKDLTSSKYEKSTENLSQSSKYSLSKNEESSMSSSTSKSAIYSKLDENTTETSEEPYIEPLRHQKGGKSKTGSAVHQTQSDVDKIVSPYGIGPTDENGVPLFGLRALKKRNTQMDTVIDPVEKKVENKYESEPTDSGHPMFGLRALKKTPTSSTFTATQSARETSSYASETSQNASESTEEEVLSTAIISEQKTEHATEVKTSSSSFSSAFHEISSDEQRNSFVRETSPGLVKQMRDSFRKKSQPSGEVEVEKTDPVKPAAKLRDSFISETNEQKSKLNEEKITRRSQPLDNIIKLHESKVSEQDLLATEVTPPKQKLRDFEPVVDTTKQTKTWDLKSDLSYRSQDVKNIIARHETISQINEETLEAAKTQAQEKKITGILKKTSSSSKFSNKSLTGTDTVKLERTMSDGQDSVVSDTYKCPENLINTLTDDQINKLSNEFDRRAQDDGVIKSETESREDIDIIGYHAQRAVKESEDLKSKFERKTSYTEIKLSQPKKGINEVKGRSSATVSTGSTSFSSTDGVSTMKEGRSFLDNKEKVTGINDVMSRMAATEAVDTEGKITSDEEARSLLNRFLGAQVLMSGMESMMANAAISEKNQKNESSSCSMSRERNEQSTKTTKKEGKVAEAKKAFTSQQTTTSKSRSGKQSTDAPVLIKGVNISDVDDEQKLNQLLDSCEQYEDRRRIRMRLRTLMAEKKALRSELSSHVKSESSSTNNTTTNTTDIRSSEDVAAVNSWLADNFPEHKKETKTTSKASVQKNHTSNTSTMNVAGTRGKPDKSKNQEGPNLPFRSSSPFSMPLPVIRHNATTIKKIILDFCKKNTAEYESKGVKIDNFSTSWNDGMAFCALIHHFYPEAFDFDKLNPKNRRHNFDLAFRMFNDKAGVAALLDVDDMVAMKKPDWKCVFTYIQSIYKALG